MTGVKRRHTGLNVSIEEWKQKESLLQQKDKLWSTKELDMEEKEREEG